MPYSGAHYHQRTSLALRPKDVSRIASRNSSTKNEPITEEHKKEIQKCQDQVLKQQEEQIDVHMEEDDSCLPPIYHDGFTIHLADLLLESKTKMQTPQKNNGVTFALIGSSGAGKSTLLRNVFINDVYGARRDKDYIVTIFTESAQSDAFVDLPKDVAVCAVGVSQDIINALKKQNYTFGKIYNFVNLLDDCIHLRHMNQVEKMFLIDRNTNMTSAVSLQYANLIPKSIRTSVYYVFLMHQSSPEGAEISIQTFLSGYVQGKNIKKKVQVYMTWARKHRFYFLDNLNEKCYAVTADFMCKELPLIIDDGDDDDENQQMTEKEMMEVAQSGMTEDLSVPKTRKRKRGNAQSQGTPRKPRKKQKTKRKQRGEM